ncbi:Potassium channel KAT2 [Bienertia sinuspersici]
MANINGSEQVVKKIPPEDIFGEIGVLCDWPQPFTVRTTELSQILRLNKTSLTHIVEANKADGHVIMSNLFMKLKTLESQGVLEQQKVEQHVYGQWFNGPQKCKTCCKKGCQCQFHECSVMNGGWRDTYKVETEECHESTTCRMDIGSAVPDSQPKFLSAVKDEDLGAVKILLGEGTDMNWRPQDPPLHQGNRINHNQLTHQKSRESYDRITIEVDEKLTPGLINKISTNHANKQSHNLCQCLNQVVANNSTSSNYIEHTEAEIQSITIRLELLFTCTHKMTVWRSLAN